MRVLRILATLGAVIALAGAFGAPASSANWTDAQEVFPLGGGYFGYSTVEGGRHGTRLVVRSTGAEHEGQEILSGRWEGADGQAGAESALSTPSGAGPRVTALESSGNADGDVCLAWIEGEWTWDRQLRARVIDGDRELGRTIELSSTDQYFDGPPKVGIDGFGRCVIVWSEPNRSEDGWLLKRRTITKYGAGPEVTLKVGRSSAPYPGQLSVAPNGLAALVVVTGENVESEFRYRYSALRFSVDSASTQVVPVASEIGTGAYLGNPVISMDVYGRSVVGWFEELREPVTSARIKAARITPIGIVIPAGAVADSRTTWLNLRLTTDRLGRGAMSWDGYAPIVEGHNESESLQVHATRVSPTSGPFGGVVAIEQPVDGNIVSDPSMQTTDSAGDTYFSVLRGVAGDNWASIAARLSRLDFDSGNVTDRAAVELGEGFALRQSIDAGTCGRATAAFSWVPDSEAALPEPRSTVRIIRSDRLVAC